MNKTRVIDLLNKIANGEEIPKRIKIISNNYNKEFYFDGDIYMYKDEYEEYAMTDDLSIEMSLNDEVEIIEEEKKIPEKLKLSAPYPECDDTRFEDVENKINEIIDCLKSRGDK